MASLAPDQLLRSVYRIPSFRRTIVTFNIGSIPELCKHPAYQRSNIRSIAFAQHIHTISPIHSLPLAVGQLRWEHLALA